MTLAAGTRFGSYEVAALIGVGGMGEVYRAHDPSLKRDVALKVLPQELIADTNRLARLQREAEMLAALNHSNVAHIYGLERSEGRTALVMEIIDGVTLAERIGQGALPPTEALDVAAQIASALEAAHERGIVHRDLKPANIKVKVDGTVKVLDFGIAKVLDLRATSGPQPPALTTPAMTETGMILGTAAYMSPEQARGKPVDKRTDIWAFGCVLYEMLTGKAAFLGDDVTTTLARLLERDPDLKALPSSVSPAVRATLALCLEKDPNRRIADMRDVRLTLAGVLTVAPPVRPLWRRALPFAATLAVGALLAGAYVASISSPVALPASPQAALPVSRFVITPPATAPLTNLGGDDLAISPDGERLAYFARNPESGGVALYVRELDGLEARLIPGTEIAEPAATLNPFFSADGKSIGFLLPGRGVMRVPVDGGPLMKMLDPPQPAFVGASWAADDTLIFSSARRLARVSAGGGTPEPLMPEIAAGAIASPQLLPGGRAVLFALIQGEVESVAVLDLSTGEQKILVEGGGHPAYAESGHVVFARGTTLMAAPFDAAELALTGEPVALLQDVRHPGLTSAADYAVSATGTLVYVPRGDEQSRRAALVWVDRAGMVVGRAVADLVENPVDPRLSPDGERLVLTTAATGDSSIWSYDLRGRPPIRLAVGNNSRAAVWSPDGRQIAFVTIGLARFPIHTLPADGRVLAPQRLLAEESGGIPQAWSAAGELLFVSGFTDNNDLRVASITGGEVRDVLATEYNEFDAALSPNGRWLAYVSNRTGANEVWVQGYPDGVAVRVSQSGGYEPHWSADGRELTYLQGNAMLAVAVETEGEFSFAAPVQLFSGSYRSIAASAASSYDVAHNGRFLMIQDEDAASTNAAPGSIVVVQNWFEELRQRVPARQ